jgi:hypothetical protein
VRESPTAPAGLFCRPWSRPADDDQATLCLPPYPVLIPGLGQRWAGHVLERELREELPGQLAGYQQELAAGQADKTRREWLEWHIRRVQKRMAEIEARPAEGQGNGDQHSARKFLLLARYPLLCISLQVCCSQHYTRHRNCPLL